MSKAVFICGTDTGVGKTYVATAMISQLVEHGVRAAGFKPCESGCRKKKGVLQRADSLSLKAAGNMEEPLDLINPYYFEEELAPGVAAERQGTKISFSKIKKNLKTLSNNYELVLVEGAGGLLVPLSGKKTNLDLIRYLNLSVILVARLGLGTINHTLLTLEHLKRHDVLVEGVLLNQNTPTHTLAEKTNVKVLKKYGVNIFGQLPFNAP